MSLTALLSHRGLVAKFKRGLNSSRAQGHSRALHLRKGARAGGCGVAVERDQPGVAG